MKNLADFLKEAKNAGAWVYGASAEATTHYDQPDYTGAVVDGARGGRKRAAPTGRLDARRPCRAATPRRIESLNVSATGAVLLYEMLQQRLDTST